MVAKRGPEAKSPRGGGRAPSPDGLRDENVNLPGSAPPGAALSSPAGDFSRGVGFMIFTPTPRGAWRTGFDEERAMAEPERPARGAAEEAGKDVTAVAKSGPAGVLLVTMIALAVLAIIVFGVLLLGSGD
jgi:hypothetical protein